MGSILDKVQKLARDRGESGSVFFDRMTRKLQDDMHRENGDAFVGCDCVHCVRFRAACATKAERGE